MNKEKEQRAIKYLKMFEPEEYPYYLCYSGGKDMQTYHMKEPIAVHMMVLTIRNFMIGRQGKKTFT